MNADFDVVDALAGFAEDLHGESNFAMRLHDAVKRLKEERDEARAEVERLRAARIEAKRLRFLLRCAGDALEVVSKKWTKPAFERGEHLPMIRSTLTAIRALPVAACGACGRHDQPHDPCDCAGEGKK